MSAVVSALANRVAIVTGANAGIGLATAEALADRGARVVLVDNDPGVEHAAAKLDATGMIVDLADATAAISALQQCARDHGHIDILVNNAGIGRHNPIDAIRLEDLDLMWAVNVRSLIALTAEAFRLMTEGGQIVNVVSTAGLRGEPGESAYCATKFAVRGFTEAAAEEGRLKGIRVHGVYPAGVDTAFWRAATADGPGVEPSDVFLRPEDVAAAITSALETPDRVHLPEVVVRAVADANLDAIRHKLDRFRQ